MVTLTGRATRWLALLQEFGHLGPEGMDRLYVGVAELAVRERHPADEPVDLHLVKRAAALVLAPLEGDAMTPALEDDWPLLFS